MSRQCSLQTLAPVMTLRSKVQVSSCLNAEIGGSIPVEDMNFRHFCFLCVVNLAASVHWL